MCFSERLITGPCFQLTPLMDTEPLPTVPLRLLVNEKGYAQKVKENGKKGDLLLTLVNFLTNSHFLRILLQIKQPPIQGIFSFLCKESWRK